MERLGEYLRADGSAGYINQQEGESCDTCSDCRDKARRTPDEVVAVMKQEIAADIAAGRVPASVSSFSELHDYVDANDYGACKDYHAFDFAFWNQVQTEIDSWIKAGRP